MAVWNTLNIKFKDDSTELLLGLRECTINLESNGKCTIKDHIKNQSFLYDDVEYVTFTKHNGGLFP